MSDDQHADWQLKLAQFKLSLPMVREAMAEMKQSYAMFAQQYRVYFDSLVAAGFTPEQALELVKAHGWMPR